MVKNKRQKSANEPGDAIPGEADWGDYKSDIDTEYAYGRFAGKHRHEVMEYFQAPLLVSEDIAAMPVIPFRYYVLIFKDYLLSPSAEGNPDGASTFLHLLIGKLQRQPQDIIPLMDELMPVAEYVASHQELFDASEEIYGTFSDLLNKIRECYASATAELES